MQFLSEFTPLSRIILISVVAVACHFLVKMIRWMSQWILGLNVGADTSTQESFVRRFPRFATVMTIVISAVTFIIYFLAVGMILSELNISLQAYLASATVIGLAIGFGLQGFVQDIIIGLTLIFSNAINIGNLVEISGQRGRVDYIGLRFTTLINLHDQKIYIPNRNINLIGRYRSTGIFITIHIQLPDDVPHDEVLAIVNRVVKGSYRQNRQLILRDPDISKVLENSTGKWHYITLQFRVWPGEEAVVETTLKQSLIHNLKEHHPQFSEWMVSVTRGTKRLTTQN